MASAASALLVLALGCARDADESTSSGEEPKGRCGDGSCGYAESCESCAQDCGKCASVCGDGVCEAVESCSQCPADCGACPAACGDGACNGAESCKSCPGDCGACPYCGDKLCDGNEKCNTCPGDCGACPPKCGDGACNGTETWDTCAADCPPPPAVTWNDPSGKCKSSSLVGDGDVDGNDWTWVRADTRQVMWEDGTSVLVFVDSEVPVGTADMYVDGSHIATIGCGLGSNGCAFFWRNPVTNRYVDFYISNASYFWQDTVTWMPCP